jgi:HK97 family phage portal protein
MSFLDRLLGRERRDAKTSDPFVAHHYAHRAPDGSILPDQVLSQLAVAHRCVAIRSELTASVPLHLYQRDANGGRVRADENPLYDVLHNMANPGQSAFEAREFLIRSLDMYGNAYARIERNGKGQVIALYPLMPVAVGVERLPSGRIRYRVSDARGGTTVLIEDEVLHIRGPSRNGVTGISPIALARGALCLALNQSETAHGLMHNSLRPSGILSYPDKLGVDSRNRVRETAEQRFTGPSQSGQLMILDGGAKFERIAFTPEDAEFLASRKLANEDVARVFGIPPTACGITDKATYSNTEQEARALVQNALGPLAARIEAAIMRCCLTPQGRRTYYAEHDLSGLLRGDVKSRFEAYRLGREIGLFSANDLARMENLPVVEGGDARYVPSNWMALGSSGQAVDQTEGRNRTLNVTVVKTEASS